MLSKKFYSGVVCIPKDRGHTVAATGPYRLILHPGYLGGIMFYLSMPLVLGSLFALIPTLLAISLIIIRTALEDRMLYEELDGYENYAKQVPRYLLPGVW
jgi:protein-S-isoprenylcysteine O-methyltransferase Ste14